ncbi:hypothetical protein SLS57_012449 [Botryosphaeria dothidea]
MQKISDGLSKLGHVHGGFLEGMAMYSPAYRAGNTKIVGRAFIVKFAPKADTAAPKVKGNYLFARGTGTTAGGAICFPSETDVPVKLQSSIQEAVINPGDYIIADLDGVVCLPQDLAEKVLEIVPGIVTADERCAEAIKNGMTVEEAFKTYRGK